MSKRIYTAEQKLAKRLYMREYIKQYRLKHPKLTRETNKLNARKFREANRDKQHKYHSEYFSNWRKLPLNAKTHSTRGIVANLRTYYLKRGKISPTYEFVWDVLHNIGWTVDMDKSLCVNHKISLKLLFTYDINLDLKIAFDELNLEIVKKVENNSASKRRVNRETVRLANKLQKKYNLKGFVEFINGYLGKVI